MKVGNFLNYHEEKGYYLSSTIEKENSFAVIFDAEKKLACSIEVETKGTWESLIDTGNPNKRLMSVDEFNQILETESLQKSLRRVWDTSFWLGHRIGYRALLTHWNSHDESIVKCAPMKSKEDVLFVYCL